MPYTTYDILKSTEGGWGGQPPRAFSPGPAVCGCKRSRGEDEEVISIGGGGVKDRCLCAAFFFCSEYKVSGGKENTRVGVMVR